MSSHHTNYHDTQKPVALSRNFLYSMSARSIKKYGKLGYKFFYTLSEVLLI
jgi:hypothetical protein